MTNACPRDIPLTQQGLTTMIPCSRSRLLRTAPPLTMLVALSACSTLGSMMSPYSEKFSCKNDDHGQCIHPEQAYEDARSGVAPRSDPKVVNDRSMLRSMNRRGQRTTSRKDGSEGDYPGYRESVYRELRGLIEQPVTPMLKAPRTVRTLILPYADRAHPDRLYMPRFIYSVADRPVWVIGEGQTVRGGVDSDGPVLAQSRDLGAAASQSAPGAEVRP